MSYLTDRSTWIVPMWIHSMWELGDVRENQRGSLEVSFTMLIWWSWSFLFKHIERDIICFICALSKGVCQSKVEPSRGRGDFTLRWELLSLLRSEMLSEHEVARAGEWEWGWGCHKQGDWSTWRLRNCWEIQGTDTGLAIEVTVFSWGSSGGYLEFVAILASSLRRKLKAIVGTVSACKGTVGRGDLFWFLFLLT